jgi:hypothetical protein
MICTFVMPVHVLGKTVTVHAIKYLPLPGSLVYYFLIKNSRLLLPIARLSYSTLLTCNRDGSFTRSYLPEMRYVVRR